MASKEEIIAALRIIHTAKVGNKTFLKLIDEYESPQKVLQALEKAKKYSLWSEEKACAEYEKAQKNNIKILYFNDDDYPQGLKQQADRPPLIYAKGNVEVLNHGKIVAIVGSRAASIGGRKQASRLAYDLTNGGACVISGMARGIDEAAHKGAMYAKAQTGETIAVLGTGVDEIYPPENKDIYNNIAINGCIISEMPLGTKASPNLFPRRNKIIASLAQAVVVVEAGLKSGSLITAELAMEQNKVILAVPGTPGETRSQGSNKLIKNGAVLVENAQDVEPYLKQNNNKKIKTKAQAKQKVLVFENNNDNLSKIKSENSGLMDLITIDGVYVDELIRLTGKKPEEVAMEILELEMDGKIYSLPGNKVALIK